MDISKLTNEEFFQMVDNGGASIIEQCIINTSLKKEYKDIDLQALFAFIEQCSESSLESMNENWGEENEKRNGRPFITFQRKHELSLFIINKLMQTYIEENFYCNDE